MLAASAMTKEARFIVGGLLPLGKFLKPGQQEFEFCAWDTRDCVSNKSWVKQILGQVSSALRMACSATIEISTGDANLETRLVML
jgi:hypothetical protein